MAEHRVEAVRTEEAEVRAVPADLVQGEAATANLHNRGETLAVEWYGNLLSSGA